jgi:protein-tyrosine kinase
MSLVEKALNKMKDSERRASLQQPSDLPGADAATSQDAVVSPPLVVAPPIAVPRAEAPEPPAVVVHRVEHRHLPIEAEAMRTKGYLPALEQERELTEQYRHIKRPLVSRATALRKSGPDGRRASIIMVCSALPGEGKTFTAINLSRSLAREQDCSVLLIDADVANPRATDVFDSRDQRGLIDALQDDQLDPESLVCDTDLGFQFLPAGTPTDMGAELFGSRRLGALLDRLLEADPKRLIMIDTAPLLITNEGKALTPLPGQVAIVVHANKTPQQAVLEAVGLFDEDQHVGVILNQSDEAVGSNFYYGSYGYGRYGYGKQGTGTENR